MMKGFSRSMKQATVMFNDPLSGRSIVQEKKGSVDANLRAAIYAAQKEFWRVYRGIEFDEPNIEAKP